MSKVQVQEEKLAKSYQRLDSVIARKFSVSYMSNAKWVKLLKAVASFEQRSYRITYKLVSCDQVKTSHSEQFEEHVDDYWFIEPSIYKEIEWLEFMLDEHNNVQSLIEHLSAIAKFPITQTPTGYKVLGYT
ncbi:DUF6678 family protein [Pseudoalteromonas luteoviolacea]|uniref:Uncharacterized protein n=1 Tax=Pseudoalteromonas luteoviolacea H33 TaxID=1365251 RepID=A0A167DNT8_9GAMM|nr:DUF6678 family protein [Pseudoalteromonas luteoviolacea]KZN49106.1 hypothetical protein N476_20565 [Pseudoalteromonas luteoviolacea H33]KZN75513.1 hypothetical protein N477_18875 [Pseudoalteromonas luteoviolacea H33-S]MBQ4878816.1 hypothetical protein [Pseudoalteromonas luteoviolacea]MBQ4907776.1 hypothetical protein [Pseudoalteromonas luteoviolacea]